MSSEVGKEVGRRYEQNIRLRFDVLSRSLVRTEQAAESMAAANTPKGSTFSQSVVPRSRDGYFQTFITPSPYEAASISANTDKPENTIDPTSYIETEVDLDTPTTGVIYNADKVREQLEEIYKKIPQSARNNLKEAA